MFAVFAASFFHPRAGQDWLIAAAWRVLHEAGRTGRLATTGPYARVRRPQYDGFLLQWPTIPTLVMFPILVFVHTRLVRAEEREVADQFGAAWRAYAAAPGLLPRPWCSAGPSVTTQPGQSVATMPEHRPR
ncbi:methyltransferase family protein [Dactylosporangium sp. NPDC000521]|uniref:methyltransferase family protein n=1 Tax=Dactylosporangium sp. NPDC000521 TaxID=3363975 RepID=UPI00368D3F94